MPSETPRNRTPRGADAEGRRDRRRLGFTVLEMLVTTGIIGLLLALLLPAVQSAREAARQTTCRSHLHQIGVAVHAFHATHGRLPRPRFAAFDILPQLGFGVLFQQLDIHPGVASVTDPPGVSVYHCPNDSWARLPERNVSYRLNSGIGSRPESKWGFKSNWVGYSDARTFADVRDGLSTTAMFAERLLSPAHYSGITNEQARGIPERATWIVAPNLPDDPDALRKACLDPQFWIQQMARTAYILGRYGELSMYGHVMAPNEPSFVTGFTDVAIAATSAHPGGVHLLLADGAVRFVHDQVDLTFWRALGTIAGQDSFGGFE